MADTGIGTTSTLSNSVRTQYIEEYVDAANNEWVYDQLATPIAKSKDILQRGSAVQVPFLLDLEPATSAISETTDLTPHRLNDTYTTVTPTSRADAIVDSELLMLQNYTDYGAARFRKIGKQMRESVDLLAQEAALQGNLVVRGEARASIDAGTTTDLLSDKELNKAANMMQTMKCPAFPTAMTGVGARWAAIMHPDVYYDIRNQDNILSVAKYQKANIILNYELGEVGPFRLVVTPWAKVFGAAGDDNASNAATTLASAASQGDKTISVALATNLSVGRFLTIGTEETANTFYSTNERVRYISESGTTITIVGEGPNGGLRFDHASGAGVRNADSVYPVAFGGPTSLAKVFAVDVGEYGQVVGPYRDGTVEQFIKLGWKWYGGYGRISESWICRGEYASSLDA